MKTCQMSGAGNQRQERLAHLEDTSRRVTRPQMTHGSAWTLHSGPWRAIADSQRGLECSQVRLGTWLLGLVLPIIGVRALQRDWT